MKEVLQQLLKQSLKQLQVQGILSKLPEDIVLTASKNSRHGDYATNIALVLAKQAVPPKKPRDLARLIVANLPASERVQKSEVAGVGFINFFIGHQDNYRVINHILEKKEKFGRSQIGTNQAILIEFVSANPTGPLHIGHGRGAAFGSSVANLLRAVGFRVDCEYYVNDAGRQMDILTLSVYLRYLQQLAVDIAFIDGGYQGDYVINIAKKLLAKYQARFKKSTQKILGGTKLDTKTDKECYIDDIISNVKQLLGEDYALIFTGSAQIILADIKSDLADFGVFYDHWFREQSLVQSGRIQNTLAALKQQQVVYKQDGALWLRSTDYGDEKDRVVVRDNGQSTYFAADIAYHQEKLTRTLSDKSTKHYDLLINIWGADHHGYIARVKAGIGALGLAVDKLEVRLVQFANLYRGKIKIPMSTRSGTFATLKALKEEVGNDAARFFYILRRADQHLDFDLELAKSKTNKNPVYYIQYAYARITQVLEKSGKTATNLAEADLSLLSTKYEKTLIKDLNQYGSVLLSAAYKREPHQLAYYLKNLASGLHRYYGACQFLGVKEPLMLARLALISAVAQTIKNGLNLLGVSAPDSM